MPFGSKYYLDRDNKGLKFRLFQVLTKLLGYPLYMGDRVRANNVMKYLNPSHGDAILDAGCGMKPYEAFFKKENGKVIYVGIDQNPNTAADVIAVGEDIPFRTCSFKIVLCTQVLEHTRNPKRVLEEILRVLVNDGLLLISTHGVWIEGHELPDLWRWTRSGLIRLLQLSGYKVYSYYSMPPFTSLIQILLLYLPEVAPLKYTIIPLLNVTAILLEKIFKNRGSKIHVVHAVKASKSARLRRSCNLGSGLHRT